MSEEYVSEERFNFYKMIDGVIRDMHPGLPEFIFESKFYNEFILPVSGALVKSAEVNTFDEMKKWCININQVTFANVNEGVYYKDYAYISRASIGQNFVINELYHESSTLWDMEIQNLASPDAYLLILIQVHKTVSIAYNILVNLRESELLRFICVDISARISRILSGNYNEHMVYLLNMVLEYIRYELDDITINTKILPFIKRNMNHVLEKENKSANEIEGIAILMRSFRIIGYGDDNEDMSL
jgi:hypothetical protein